MKKCVYLHCEKNVPLLYIAHIFKMVEKSK